VEGSSAWFTNTIVYSHTQGVVNDGGVVTMTQTLWEGNLTPTVGLILEEGSFDGTEAFDADGYHLTGSSDAIEAGASAGVFRDLDDEPRLDLPDLGADEYWAPGDTWRTLHLPLIMSNSISYFNGPWEVEPNNDYEQANGPLRSGRDYYGYPDEKDYFSFDSSTSGNIIIDLMDYMGTGAQLELYYESVDGQPVATDQGAPYYIEYTGPSGPYFVYIYSAGGWSDDYPFTLRVTYP